MSGGVQYVHFFQSWLWPRLVIGIVVFHCIPNIQIRVGGYGIAVVVIVPHIEVGIRLVMLGVAGSRGEVDPYSRHSSPRNCH